MNTWSPSREGTGVPAFCPYPMPFPSRIVSCPISSTTRTTLELRTFLIVSTEISSDSSTMDCFRRSAEILAIGGDDPLVPEERVFPLAVQGSTSEVVLINVDEAIPLRHLRRGQADQV